MHSQLLIEVISYNLVFSLRLLLTAALIYNMIKVSCVRSGNSFYTVLFVRMIGYCVNNVCFNLSNLSAYMYFQLQSGDDKLDKSFMQQLRGKRRFAAIKQMQKRCRKMMKSLTRDVKQSKVDKHLFQMQTHYFDQYYVNVMFCTVQ